MTAEDLGKSAARPTAWVLRTFRPAARAALRLRWRMDVHGAEHVPASGAVILAANHIGLMDGPLLAIFSPRPVHVLAKTEMFDGRLGPVLHAAGQIPLDRFAVDPAAIKAALRVLDDGGVAGIFPEGTRGDGRLTRFHHGAAYLALVSGAPVVPVTMLGTREPGGASHSLPSSGARLHIVFGQPWTCEPVPWPRTKEHLSRTSALLQSHMRERLDEALTSTGARLPGPLPIGQQEDELPRGLTDQGAP